MSTDLEQRLRAEMEQAVVQPRPGLVREAYRGYRRKRRMRRTAVAAGTAAAIAAGTAAGVTAATTAPAVSAQTTAYVVSHVNGALAANSQITYTTTVTSFVLPKTGALTSRITEIWDYGTRIRQRDETASGQPVTEDWQQAGPGQPTCTLVDYQQRTWEHGTVNLGGSAPQQSRCQAPEMLTLLLASGMTPGFSDWPSMIESGLRCGLFRLVGHQRVDGIDTIKLTVSAPTGITLWVDPHTYLPVQLAGNLLAPVTGPKGPPKPEPEGTIRVRFRWLPPTQANLALPTGTIPPGFHLTHPR